MLDEKTKLEEYFKAEIQRVSDLQIRDIEHEIRNIRQQSMASLEETAQQEAEMLKDNELREMQSEQAIALSHLHEETSRKLMEKRRTLSEAVFREVKENVSVYSKTKEYADLMLKKIKTLKEDAQEHAVLHMAMQDEALLRQLCDEYGHGCEGKLDASITIGGFLLEYEDSGIVMDETFDTAIEEQRRWFYANSGLFIK